VANVDAALIEQILDLPQRQRETDLHHHRKANDLGRRLEVAERIFHSLTLPGAHLQLKPGSSDNASPMDGCTIPRPVKPQKYG